MLNGNIGLNTLRGDFSHLFEEQTITSSYCSQPILELQICRQAPIGTYVLTALSEHCHLISGEIVTKHRDVKNIILASYQRTFIDILKPLRGWKGRVHCILMLIV